MKKLALTLLLAAVAGPALAQSAAVSVVGTPNNLANAPFTLGYEFSTSQSFDVFGLGIFDAGNDGLAEAHDVGLWDASGTLLASTTVGAGLSGILVDGSRFASVTPFSISAGTYRVGAVYTSGLDPNFFGGDGTLTSLPGVTFLSGAYAVGSTLADPTSLGGGSPSYIGGNVLLGTAVPEPATWALMLGGFGLLGGAMRRRSAVAVRFA